MKKIIAIFFIIYVSLYGSINNYTNEIANQLVNPLSDFYIDGVEVVTERILSSGNIQAIHVKDFETGKTFLFQYKKDGAIHSTDKDLSDQYRDKYKKSTADIIYFRKKIGTVTTYSKKNEKIDIVNNLALLVSLPLNSTDIKEERRITQLYIEKYNIKAIEIIDYDTEETFIFTYRDSDSIIHDEKINKFTITKDTLKYDANIYFNTNKIGKLIVYYYKYEREMIPIDIIYEYLKQFGLILILILLFNFYWIKRLSVVNKKLRISQDDLKKLAYTDPLTQVYNRHYFYKSSTDLLNAADREKVHTSLIMLDVDKFKLINDTFGHTIGDKVLVSLSNVLKNTIRESDILCRYGGEEFIILLPNTSKEGAEIIAEKLRSKVESTPNGEKENLQITISLGIASVAIGNKLTIEMLIDNADRALYEAKETGRNKVCVSKV